MLAAAAEQRSSPAGENTKYERDEECLQAILLVSRVLLVAPFYLLRLFLQSRSRNSEQSHGWNQTRWLVSVFDLWKVRVYLGDVSVSLSEWKLS